VTAWTVLCKANVLSERGHKPINADGEAGPPLVSGAEAAFSAILFFSIGHRAKDFYKRGEAA